MLIETVVGKISSEFIDAVVGKIVDRLAERLKTEHHLIENRLASIEEKLERQLAIHLNAALIYLQTNDYGNARAELVRAVAADPYASSARFWYAVVLYVAGERILAQEEYTKAFLLNPFIGQRPDAPPDGIREVAALPLPTNTWTVDLNDQAFLKGLPSPVGLRRRVAQAFSSEFRKFGAIKRLSCSGGHPVVFWQVGSNLDADGQCEHFVSAFDISSAAHLWSVPVSGEFCFATPRVVVLKSSDSECRYELLDRETGKTAASMGSEYYRTVFCPNEDNLAQLQVFRQSNISLAGPTKAQPSGRFALATSYDDDIGVCSDPFRGDIYALRAVNRWWRQTQVGSPVGVLGVTLCCHATLTRVS